MYVMLEQQHQLTQGENLMARNETSLSVPATARKLGCTLRYVYDLVYAGRLKAKKVAGRWKIPVAEVETRLKKRVEQ
jgi:excisionase family DNA binding protein